MNIELEFRRGFCEKLASRGVAPDDVSAALEKFANPGGDGGGSGDGKSLLSWLSGPLKGSLGLLGKGLGGVGKGTAFTVFMMPALMAGIAGHYLAKSKKVSPADIKATSDTILIRELEEQNRLLAERKAQRVL